MFADVKLTTLENGVRVVSSVLPHVESVAMGIALSVGSRHETRAMAGASHYLEHLLFKGTPKRSALDISRAIEGRGGYLNAFTQEESTCYYARCSFDRLAPSFDVLADMVLNANCAKADVEKERQVILEEIRMYRDQPHCYVQELMQESVWPGHALGRPVIGYDETVGAMTADAIRDYKTKNYVPGAIVAAFAGKLEHAKCVDYVASLFADLKPRRRARLSRFPESRRPSLAVAVEREIEQTHLSLAFRGFGRKDPRRHALRVLNTVLGANMSSRLFQVVREKHGLAYSIHSWTQLFADSGMFCVGAGLDRQRSAKALQLILKEIDRVRMRKVTAGELRRAKDYIVGQLRLGLENTSNQMMWVSDSILTYGKFIDPEETLEAVRNVTAEEIQDLASSLFNKQNISVAMVTPVGDRMTAAQAEKELCGFC